MDCSYQFNFHRDLVCCHLLLKIKSFSKSNETEIEETNLVITIMYLSDMNLIFFNIFSVC